MKLHAELNGEEHEITIRRAGRSVYAEVDGREYYLEADQPEPGIYLLKHDGKVYQIAVSGPSGQDRPISVSVRQHELEITIFDPRKLRGSVAAAAAAGGMAEIKTAMPGKVVRVLADAGSEISAGEGVLVVEAMKMQNEMKSPKDGIVKEIRFAEGATVNAGDVLAIIE